MIDDEKKQPDYEDTTIMSKEEVHDYEGVTLGEDGREEKQERHEPEMEGIHIHVFNPRKWPLWKKILYGAIALGILAVLIMIFWFFLMGAGYILLALLLVYFIRKLFF